MVSATGGAPVGFCHQRYFCGLYDALVLGFSTTSLQSLGVTRKEHLRSGKTTPTNGDRCRCQTISILVRILGKDGRERMHSIPFMSINCCTGIRFDFLILLSAYSVRTACQFHQAVTCAAMSLRMVPLSSLYPLCLPQIELSRLPAEQ